MRSAGDALLSLMLCYPAAHSEAVRKVAASRPAAQQQMLLQGFTQLSTGLQPGIAGFSREHRARFRMGLAAFLAEMRGVLNGK